MIKDEFLLHNTAPIILYFYNIICLVRHLLRIWSENIWVWQSYTCTSL